MNENILQNIPAADPKPIFPMKLKKVRGSTDVRSRKQRKAKREKRKNSR